MLLGDPDVVEGDGARRGGPLTHAVPVVDDLQTRCITRDEGQRLGRAGRRRVAGAVRRRRPDDHPVGEECSRGVELAAGQHVVTGPVTVSVVVSTSPRAGRVRSGRWRTGPAVHEAVEELLLRRRALKPQRLQKGEVRLRDLGQRRVGVRRRRGTPRRPPSRVRRPRRTRRAPTTPAARTPSAPAPGRAAACVRRRGRPRPNSAEGDGQRSATAMASPAGDARPTRGRRTHRAAPTKGIEAGAASMRPASKRPRSRRIGHHALAEPESSSRCG